MRPGHDEDPGLRTRRNRNNQLELLKWIALVAMTIDHYGKIVEPSYFAATHAIGRMAYPLFTWIIASRLAANPALTPKYLSWLLVWALLSQPVYVIAGKEWMQWNIMFTLFFGVLAYVGIDAVRQHKRWQATAFFAAASVGSLFADYSPFGVMLIPVLAICLQRRENAALSALAPLSLAANITTAAPYFSLLDLPAGLSAPVVYLARLNQVPIPRLPKLFFYAYYPAHIYLLHLTDRYLL